MIKPNEIMLGDYFLVGKDVKKYMFVASINNSNILFDYINNDGYLYESQGKYIIPIPITESLLRNIGFSNTFSKEVLTKDIDTFTIDMTKEGEEELYVRIYDEDIDYLLANVYYLHELQQAVRLVTKKELTIEL